MATIYVTSKCFVIFLIRALHLDYWIAVSGIASVLWSVKFSRTGNQFQQTPVTGFTYELRSSLTASLITPTTFDLD